MEDILAKLAKILAMTESSDAEEARTAAMTAVRMIKKHNIQFQLPSSQNSTPPSVASGDWRQYFQEMFVAGRAASPWSPTPSPPPPPPAPATPSPPPKPKSSKPKAPPTLIRSRYGGPCLLCRKRYFEGDMVYWRQRDGTTHEGCRSYWDDVD